MLLDSRSRLPSPSPKIYDKPTLASSDTSESSSGSYDSDPASLATCSVPTASLLVTNLPTLLFSQAQDLHPLFLPFGHIEKLEIVQVSPLGTMSVVVQYSAAHVAQEAKETLSGQLYGSYQIEARYVKPIASTLLDSGLTTADRKTNCTVFTPGDFLGQPRAVDDRASCFDTGRIKGHAHSSQLGLATGPFFHRNPLSISPPRPAFPLVFPGNFQDYDSSRLSSVDSRFVYFVRLFLPVSLSVGGTWTKDMGFKYIHIHSFCRIKCTITLCTRALLLECFPVLGSRLLKCFDNLRLPCFSDSPSLFSSCFLGSVLFLEFYSPFAYRFVLAGCYIGLKGRKVGCRSDFVADLVDFGTLAITVQNIFRHKFPLR